MEAAFCALYLARRNCCAETAMLQLAIASLSRPGPSISSVLRYDVPNSALLCAATLLACFTGIVDPLIALFVGGSDVAAAGNAPFLSAAMQLVVILVTAFAVYRVGTLFGGTGDLNGALKVSVWYGVVSIIPSIAFLLFQASGSAFAPIVQFIVLIWMLYTLSSFVQVLHGFESLFMTALGVIGTSFVIGIVSVLVLSALGFIQPGNL